jgi:putative hemolysin
MLNLDTTLNWRLDRARLPFATRPAPQFDVSWATTWAEVREAQRLRYRVFALEMGARLPSHRHGLDADEFDAYCDHLLVRESRGGAVIGTYRVLAAGQAQAAGGLYTDEAFELAPLDRFRPRLAELGRACVDARHRHGGVILALWRALADYMVDHQVSTMVGCCSIPLTDGGRCAASLWRRLSRTHLVEPALQVRPKLPYPVHLLDHPDEAEAPALLEGYLRLGARVLGAPAWDPDFGCADLPLLLQLDDIAPRYRSRLPQSVW